MKAYRPSKEGKGKTREGDENPVGGQRRMLPAFKARPRDQDSHDPQEQVSAVHVARLITPPENYQLLPLLPAISSHFTHLFSSQLLSQHPRATPKKHTEGTSTIVLQKGETMSPSTAVLLKDRRKV